MGLLTSGAAGGAGLSSAEVFGARQFVAGIVDHFVGLQLGRGVGTKAGNLTRKNRDDEQQKRLNQQRSQHAAVGKNAVRSFTREARSGTSKRRTDGGDELVPTRRPFDQQLGRIVKLDDPDFFELESFDQVKIRSSTCTDVASSTPRSLASLGMTDCGGDDSL